MRIKVRETKKAEAVPSNMVSRFVIDASARIKANKLMATLEDTILASYQNAEIVPNADGSVTIEVDGRLDPVEASGALRIIGKLGIPLRDLAINIAK